MHIKSRDYNIETMNQLAFSLTTADVNFKYIALIELKILMP